MTQSQSVLDGLVERLKKATGPDREIDGRLWCHFTPNREFLGMAHRGQVWGDFEPGGFNPKSGMMEGMVFRRTDFKGTREDIQKNGGRIQQFPSSPAYTASVDAALALAERVLPGRAVAMGLSTNPSPYCGIAPNILVNAATLPLAICLATLSALQSLEAL